MVISLSGNTLVCLRFWTTLQATCRFSKLSYARCLYPILHQRRVCMERWNETCTTE